MINFEKLTEEVIGKLQAAGADQACCTAAASATRECEPCLIIRCPLPG